MTLALGSYSLIVVALGTGQRPPTANRTPPLDWLRLQQGERQVVNQLNHRTSKTDTNISMCIHVLIENSVTFRIFPKCYKVEKCEFQKILWQCCNNFI